MSIFVEEMEEPVLEKWHQYEEEGTNGGQGIGISCGFLKHKFAEYIKITNMANNNLLRLRVNGLKF